MNTKITNYLKEEIKQSEEELCLKLDIYNQLRKDIETQKQNVELTFLIFKTKKETTDSKLYKNRKKKLSTLQNKLTALKQQQDDLLSYVVSCRNQLTWYREDDTDFDE